MFGSCGYIIRQNRQGKTNYLWLFTLCNYLLGFGRTNSQSVLILLFALYGLYSAATDGIQKALVSDLIDKNKRGTGLGLYNCLVGITLLPASVLAGLLYDHVNNSAPFYYGSIMALIAAMLMLIFYWKGNNTTQLN